MSQNLQFALQAAWKVLLVGLILGAGLPTLFALGVRSLAWGAGGSAEVTDDGTVAKANPIGTVLGWVCFVVVLLGVALGITYIVASGFGKMLSFEHVFPTIVDKK
ncbi:hypothetical protein [Dactylosporangium sp. CS-033363]|uniref:hypothetical protein n=1 Tax=Dactylosporangium sp. CS-033363 TaxID=3239935 RepID=UPI003D937ABC